MDEDTILPHPVLLHFLIPLVGVVVGLRTDVSFNSPWNMFKWKFLQVKNSPFIALALHLLCLDMCLINCLGLILPVKFGSPAFSTGCMFFYYIYLCKKNDQIYGGETLASVVSCINKRQDVTLMLISLLNRLETIAGHKNLHTACLLYKGYSR